MSSRPLRHFVPAGAAVRNCRLSAVNGLEGIRLQNDRQRAPTLGGLGVETRTEPGARDEKYVVAETTAFERRR